jgi:hypothetical protein
MGGEGSGRPPSVNTIVAREANFIKNLPSGEPIILPNYSGVKDFARKDRNVSVGSGHTIQDEGVNMTTRANLNFSGAAVELIDDVGNDATIVSITGGSGDVTSAQFNDLSGSYWAVVPELSGAHYTLNTDVDTLSGAHYTLNTDVDTLSGAYYSHISVFNNLSGAHYTLNTDVDTLSGAYYTTKGHVATISGALWHLSGAYYTHAGDSSDPHGANLTQTNIKSSGEISGAKIHVDMITGRNFYESGVINEISGSNYFIDFNNGNFQHLTISGANVVYLSFIPPNPPTPMSLSIFSTINNFAGVEVSKLSGSNIVNRYGGSIDTLSSGLFYSEGNTTYFNHNVYFYNNLNNTIIDVPGLASN